MIIDFRVLVKQTGDETFEPSPALDVFIAALDSEKKAHTIITLLSVVEQNETKPETFTHKLPMSPGEFTISISPRVIDLVVKRLEKAGVPLHCIRIATLETKRHTGMETRTITGVVDQVTLARTIRRPGTRAPATRYTYQRNTEPALLSLGREIMLFTHDPFIVDYMNMQPMGPRCELLTTTGSLLPEDKHRLLTMLSEPHAKPDVLYVPLNAFFDYGISARRFALGRKQTADAQITKELIYAWEKEREPYLHPAFIAQMRALMHDNPSLQLLPITGPASTEETYYFNRGLGRLKRRPPTMLHTEANVLNTFKRALLDVTLDNMLLASLSTVALACGCPDDRIEEILSKSKALPLTSDMLAARFADLTELLSKESPTEQTLLTALKQAFSTTYTRIQKKSHLDPQAVIHVELNKALKQDISVTYHTIACSPEPEHHDMKLSFLLLRREINRFLKNPERTKKTYLSRPYTHMSTEFKAQFIPAMEEAAKIHTLSAALVTKTAREILKAISLRHMTDPIILEKWKKQWETDYAAHFLQLETELSQLELFNVSNRSRATLRAADNTPDALRATVAQWEQAHPEVRVLYFDSESVTHAAPTHTFQQSATHGMTLSADQLTAAQTAMYRAHPVSTPEMRSPRATSDAEEISSSGKHRYSPPGPGSEAPSPRSSAGDSSSPSSSRRLLSWFQKQVSNLRTDKEGPGKPLHPVQRKLF